MRHSTEPHPHEQIVDARFAGGAIVITRLDDYRGTLTRLDAPGYSLDLFPAEAAALAAALTAAEPQDADALPEAVERYDVDDPNLEPESGYRLASRVVAGHHYIDQIAGTWTVLPAHVVDHLEPAALRAYLDELATALAAANTLQAAEASNG